MIRFLPILWLGFAAVASGEEPAVEACVLRSPEVAPGVEEAYLAALQIETRKMGLGLDWASIGDPEECRSGRPLLWVSDRVRLSIGADSHEFDLDAVAEVSRPRLVATSVMSRITDQLDERDEAVPLLGFESISLGGKRNASKTEGLILPKRQRNASWMFRVGGGYSVQSFTFLDEDLAQDRHSGGPALEVGVLLLRERVSVSLAGRYGWGSYWMERIDTSLALASGEVLASVRGGIVTGPWRFRVGPALGWRSQNTPFWPSLEEEWEEKRDDEEREDEEREDRFDDYEWLNTGMAVVEFEVAWHLSERWHLSLVGGPQFDFKRVTAVDEFADVAPFSPYRVAFRGVLSLGFQL